MSSLVAYYTAASAGIIALSIIFQVNGQPTVEVSEKGDSSNIVVEEIHQLRVELLGQLNEAVLSMKEFINASSQQNLIRTQQDIRVDNYRSQEQVQSIHEVLNGSFLQMRTILQAVHIKQIQSVHELFNASFQELKNQQDTVVTSLQAVHRGSQEQNVCIKQIQSVHELLNTSFQQMNNINASFQLMKNQQDTIVTSLQAVHRGSQEQDICIKQIQSVHVLFNASFQELKNQQDTIVTSIRAVDRRSQEQNIYIKQIQSIHRLLNETNLHDISIRNKTQISWKRETAFATDVGEVPIFVSFAYDWIVLMNRFDGSLNFNRSWTEYKNGFGDIGRGEFWLGNEKIHRLTNTHGVAYTLRIDIQPDASDKWYYADYDTFSIDSESNKYTLHLSGFSGNAGDSLTNTSLGTEIFIDGMKFTTFDNDNDDDRYVNSNCAMNFVGGWWFNNCHAACLTCSYYYSFGFQWYSLRHLSSDGIGKLRAARMMIKSK